MVSIRLLLPLRFDHFEIPAGTVIAVPAGLAGMAVQRRVAEMVEPERAVVEPQETRVQRPQPSARPSNGRR